MRHCFIINPAAGKDQRSLKIIPSIHAYFENHSGEYEVYITKGHGDATDAVRTRCNEGVATRFYACGGDGTLMEVLNGLFGVQGMEIACIPCGSANDYIKSLGGSALFSSIEAQVNGQASLVDAISCNDRLSLNICNVGMDADVAQRMIHYKNLPLVSGPMAYNLAVIYMFFQKIGRRLHAVIETENGVVEQQGNFLFMLAASGQYYGGGYHGAPQARPNDGLLDFVFVDVIKRPQVLGFLKRYKGGQHLQLPIVHAFRGTSMRVSSPENVTICVDGECFSDNEVQFRILPSAVSFAIPAGVSLDYTAQEPNDEMNIR